MIWATHNSQSCLFVSDCIDCLHLWLQRIKSIWFWYWLFGVSMCRVFSCVVVRGCLLWPVHSLGKTLLSCALLHFVLQGQICLLLQISLFQQLPSLFQQGSQLFYRSSKLYDQIACSKQESVNFLKLKVFHT